MGTEMPSDSWLELHEMIGFFNVKCFVICPWKGDRDLPPQSQRSCRRAGGMAGVFAQRPSQMCENIFPFKTGDLGG